MLPILFITGLLCLLLLDNVPFSSAYNRHSLVPCTILFGIFVILSGLQYFFSLFGDSAATASRSQFRAVHSPRRRWNWWFLSLLFLTISTSAQWSEGCAVDMDSAGAVDPLRGDAAKEHVEELQFAFEPPQTKTKNCIKKRSYRRALKRAETHGFTLYKGRLCTAQQLGTKFIGSSQELPQKINITQNRKLKRKRLTCCSWNCSGLSPSGWDYIQQWIDCQRLDVLMLQETHWRHTSEWTTEHYYVLHSGAGSGHAGLLCMISKDLCAMHDLSWQEVIPGRLLHFRIHGRDRDLDFINIYQHIHARDRMDDRHHLWMALQTLLTRFPKRNHLTILGDRNTSLRKTSTAVGLDTFLWHESRCGGPNHTDSNIMHNILQQFDLLL